jgi:hypothetical protein
MYSPISVVYVLMVDEQELYALSEEDLMNEATVNHLRNQSRMLFQSLREIFSMQPEARKWNISRKRKPLGPQSSEPPPALNPPKSTRKPSSTVLYNNANS